jgi:two-component system response regulator RegA
MSRAPPPGTTLLLVDDDDTLRERLARALIARGYPTVTARDYDAALAAFDAEPPDLAVLDLKMPGRSGLELLRALKDRDPDVPVIVLSGYGSIPTAVDAVRLGALDFVSKPADVDAILAAFGREVGAAIEDDLAPPSLARTEWEHIQRVLTECGGNISEAARRLRMHRRTLQRKLGKHPPRA